MTATTLTRPTIPDHGLAQEGIRSTAAVPTGRVEPPPTQLGRTSPRDKVEAAWALARRAVGYAAEQVPMAEAARRLVADAAVDPVTLRLAGDYLSFRTVTDNLYEQVTALFMVEDAERLLPKLARRQAWRDRLRRTVPRVAGGCSRLVRQKMGGVGR